MTYPKYKENNNKIIIDGRHNIREGKNKGMIIGKNPIGVEKKTYEFEKMGKRLKVEDNEIKLEKI